MAVLMEQYLLSHFNSQPHEEADGEISPEEIKAAVFQLTASRRG